MKIFNLLSPLIIDIQLINNLIYGYHLYNSSFSVGWMLAVTKLTFSDSKISNLQKAFYEYHQSFSRLPWKSSVIFYSFSLDILSNEIFNLSIQYKS